MLYVVTAVHNRKAITEKFVDLLLMQTVSDIQLILVDDGSTDGTADAVRAKMPNAVILTGDGNLWWGGGLHKAYKWLKKNGKEGSAVMFANDDTDFPCDYIERALAILKEKENCLVTGYGVSLQSGKQVDGAVSFRFPTMATAFKGDKESYGNCASTRNLFFRLSDMKRIGGFHPRLLPHYGSDYEWTLRACRKKKMQVYCTDALRYSVNEETTGCKCAKGAKQLFSKKSVQNPVYKVTFICLAAPWGKKMRSVFSQFVRMIKGREDETCD